MHELKGIQGWYRAQCDGDWEHQYGVSIESLDNPGWSIRIDLAHTELTNRSFEGVDIERSEDDWIHARVDDGRWQAACGALNLEEALALFLDWANTS